MRIVSKNILFCEGGQKDNEKKIDEQFYGNCVISNSTSNVTPIPVGGKHQFPNFILGYNKANSTSNHWSIQDRDFDIEPTEKIQLLVDKNKPNKFYTYLPCIESYFLDSELIFNYLTWLSKTPKHAGKAVPSQEEIKILLKYSAENIKDYSAVRWALHQINPSPVYFTNNWLGGSGKLPKEDELDENFCKEKVKDLLRVTEQKAKLDFSEFEKELEKYQTIFSKPDFWEKEEFLKWFHGKDLKTAFGRKIIASKLERFDFSLDKMMREICKVDNPINFPISESKNQDLFELRNILKNV